MSLILPMRPLSAKAARHASDDHMLPLRFYRRRVISPRAARVYVEDTGGGKREADAPAVVTGTT